jgi:ribosomal-protein-alanine acetyltransferase
VYEDLLVDPSRLTLVIVREDRLAGFLVCHSCGVEAEVETLAVDESLRRQGAGNQLMQAAVAWCLERGVEQIGLEVRAGSVAAYTLYARWGFKVVGRRPCYYADPKEDALLMRLDLAAEARQRAKV